MTGRISQYLSILAALATLVGAAPATAGLAERLAAARDVQLAGDGVRVEDATLSIGHLTLTIYAGTVHPVVAGDGTEVGFFFEGNGRYTYTSDDVADRSILENNLEKTGNGDLLQRGVVTDVVDRAFAFTSRPLEDLPWASSDTLPVDDRVARGFERVWKRVAKTYLENDHLLEEARTNGRGRYVYLELEGKKETIGFLHDAQRHYYERLFSFRKFSGYDLRFFEPLSTQLVDGGPTKQPVPLTLVDLDLDVATEDNRTVRIVADQTFEVARPLSTVVLWLDNNADPFAYDWESERYALEVSAVRDGAGRELAWSHRYHELLVELAEPVAAGDRLELHVELEGDYIRRELKEDGRDLFSLHTGAWYPQPSGWNASRFTMSLRFKTRKPYRPVSSGELVALHDEGEFRVLEAKSERPVKLIALFAGEYTSVEREFEGLTVRVHAYTPRGEASKRRKERLDNLARLAFGMIEYYGTALVPYPYDTIEILDLPDFNGGIAPAGMALMGAPTFGNRGVNHVLAHELAHQWFGHMAAPAASRDRWLSESFAEYVSGLAMATLAGRNRTMFDFKQMHEQWWTDAIDSREAGSIAAADTLSGSHAGLNRFRLLYSKGPLVLRMLHAQLGNERFYELLRGFLRRADYGHVTTDDFREAAERIAGQPMDWYFRQWIEEGGLPEIEVEHRVLRAGGTTTLAGTATLADGHPFKTLAIPVVLEYEGRDPEVRWVAFEQPRTTFEFPLADAPKRVKIDPARNILAVFK